MHKIKGIRDIMKKYITCAICAVIAFLTAYSGIFGSLDKMLEDTLYHNPGSINEKIRIIKIDDKTMNQLGDFSEWDRNVYADLIEKICVSEAKKGIQVFQSKCYMKKKVADL